MGKMVESKLLFPIIEGLPIGKTDSLITYSICSNGIFQTKKICGKGTITSKIEGIKGLPEGNESIDILPRKIPISYFWEIVNFFRYTNMQFKKPVEVYILLGYNFDTDSFVLYVPRHSVNGASVSYDIQSFWTDNPGYYCILDAHLHPNFGAFWSQTDSNDDNRDRFSMVIGHQDKPIPEYKLRFANGKKHIDFNIEELFSDEKESIYFDYHKAIAKITIKDQPPAYVSGNTGMSVYNSLMTKFKNKKIGNK